MRVTLLGVGGSAGTPQIGGEDGLGDWGELDPNEPRNFRSRPSIAIETPEGKTLLVDTGPDMRRQLMAAGIGKVDAVFFTHSHADHITGLDDIRILNRLLGAPMPSYTDAVTWGELRQRFDYAFKPYHGGWFTRPVLEVHEVTPGGEAEILGMQLRLIDQDHGFIRSMGLRIGDFAYCTDVVRLDETALDTLTGLDLFVVDCFTRGAAHQTHANLDQVRAWVDRLRPRRTILTHMGLNMDYRWLCETLPPEIEPGYDGMVLEV
jgi:phosphoribosyl 1,2-cyclic phosphate phosphodiesterase